MKTLKKIMILLGIGMFLAFVTGCEKEGPMEKAGKKIDKTVEKAGDKIEETGENIRDAAKDAGK